VMVSPLNNVFTFRNAHTCLQCAAYQVRGGSNFPRQMTRVFRTHKPTAKESGECVLSEQLSISIFHCYNAVALACIKVLFGVLLIFTIVCCGNISKVCNPYVNPQ
jgi:hypothetical protein